MRRYRPATSGLRRPFQTTSPSSEPVSRSLIKEGPVYDMWREVHDMGDGTPFAMNVARNKQGHWIGLAREAKYLCDRMGIAPELVGPDDQVCSVGRSLKDGKWYGWSHRAISGFPLRERAAEFARSVS